MNASLASAFSAFTSLPVRICISASAASRYSRSVCSQIMRRSTGTSSSTGTATAPPKLEGSRPPTLRVLSSLWVPVRTCTCRKRAFASWLFSNAPFEPITSTRVWSVTA